MKKYVFIIVGIIIVIVFSAYLRDKYNTATDRTNITKVQFHAFNNIYNGLNAIYDNETIEKKFPDTLTHHTEINGKKLSDFVSNKIFEVDGDPWGNSFVYLVSPDQHYCAFVSKGKNGRTGQLELNNAGTIVGVEKDDIYVIFKFNEEQLSEENPRIVQKYKVYYPKTWQSNF